MQLALFHETQQTCATMLHSSAQNEVAGRVSQVPEVLYYFGRRWMCGVEAANTRVLSPLALLALAVNVKNGRQSASDDVITKCPEQNAKAHVTLQTP